MNEGMRYRMVGQLVAFIRRLFDVVIQYWNGIQDKTHFLIWLLTDRNRNFLIESIHTVVRAISDEYHKDLNTIRSNCSSTEISSDDADMEGYREWPNIGQLTGVLKNAIGQPFFRRVSGFEMVETQNPLSLRDCKAVFGDRAVTTSQGLFKAIKHFQENVPMRNTMVTAFVHGLNGKVIYVELCLSPHQIKLTSVQEVRDIDALKIFGHLVLGHNS